MYCVLLVSSVHTVFIYDLVPSNDQYLLCSVSFINTYCVHLVSWVINMYCVQLVSSIRILFRWVSGEYFDMQGFKHFCFWFFCVPVWKYLLCENLLVDQPVVLFRLKANCKPPCWWWMKQQGCILAPEMKSECMWWIIFIARSCDLRSAYKSLRRWQEKADLLALPLPP